MLLGDAKCISEKLVTTVLSMHVYHYMTVKLTSFVLGTYDLYLLPYLVCLFFSAVFSSVAGR